VERSTVFRMDTDAVRPRGTAWNSRVAALAFSSWKSSPAWAKMAWAVSRVIQPSTMTRPMLSSAVTRSNCGPVQLFCTVAQPYEAGAVSWTMRTPAARCRAPSSYL
jgi:hypothetical protein